ncbi:MAG TPA: flagellar biosynthesis anti-sigma factor FlgM [Rhodanobacteraceae bacterium]
MVEGISTPLTRLDVPEDGPRTQAARAHDSENADAASAARTSVSVSPRAQLGAQIIAAAHASDGVDAALVARLGTAIHDGTYKVSPDAIAAAMTAVDGSVP